MLQHIVNFVPINGLYLILQMKTNESLPLKVANQLKKDPLLKDAEIAVELYSHEVIVSGKVNKFFKKALACKIVSEITGIKSVIDRIEVQLINPDQFNDEIITKAIVEKFEKNFGNSYKNIEISIKNGHVTLEGTLKWKYQKMLATDCITYLEGIVSIQNNIAVGTVSEPIISEKDILAAIYKEKSIISDISVDVNGRKVIVAGNVPSTFQKNLIEKIVRSVPGVTEMESRLLLVKKI